nr:hypothetical protein [Tanacetum cinerariifolium]
MKGTGRTQVSINPQSSLVPQVKELVQNQGFSMRKRLLHDVLSCRHWYAISSLLDMAYCVKNNDVILEWGSKNKSEHSEDSQLNSDEEEKKDKDGDANDENEDNDHISDIQDTNDEDVETKSDKDEIYEYKI